MISAKIKVAALTLVLFAVSICLSQAQVNNENVATYDIIYLKNGKVLRGEILIFEEEDGDITFIDNLGRKYSLTRFEYDYFIEDRMIRMTESDTIIIRERKSNEWELSLGFSAMYSSINPNFKSDDYYLNSVDQLVLIPLCFRIGAGKFLNRQNFIGINSEIAFGGEASKYFNVGLRYFHQYDAYKRNVSFYIPIAIDYTNLSYETYYQTNDTTFTQNGWYYPSDIDLETSINAISLNLGQGISFILENKKSISAELSFQKSFILSTKIINPNNPIPNTKLKIGGLKLSLLYNI